MEVTVAYRESTFKNSSFTCTHVCVVDGTLRLENRPNSQQRAVGMSTVKHVVSFPLGVLLWWKERPDEWGN